VLAIAPDIDILGQAWQRYGLHRADEPALVLVRPDGYVMGRWHGLDPAPLRAALKDTGVLA
jgi:3-(3-hydroxy-phenyl)propionate hydroxylase